MALVSTLTTGFRGENTALTFLLGQGYNVLTQNWRYKNHHEIDLVALSPEGHLVAIEVKTLENKSDFAPFENVTKEKIHRLKEALTLFAHQFGYSNRHLQIDVVSITYQPEEIEHFMAVDI
jgi:putative endonuclease